MLQQSVLFYSEYTSADDGPWSLHRPISLAFETVLFVLTLVKFCMFFGETRRQSIMMRLMKDGTWAYAIIFGEVSASLHPRRPSLIGCFQR